MAESKEQLIVVKVIINNHTHNGKPIKKGSTIEVAKNQLQWLIKNNIIEG